MADYVRIEWSGYYDFPQENYTTGTKAGLPISGVFDSEDIDIRSSGSASYEIDEGKIGIPTSPFFSFTLKNRDRSTGVEKYPYEYIASLGRTSEYGGSSDSIGELFIKVFLPNKGNKLIFFGMLEDFSYSVRNFEVEINCSDFMRFVKNSTYKLFKTYDFGTCTIGNQYNIPQSQDSTLRRATGGLQGNGSMVLDIYNKQVKLRVIGTQETSGLSLKSLYEYDIPQDIGNYEIENSYGRYINIREFIDFSKSEILHHFLRNDEVFMNIYTLEDKKVSKVNLYCTWNSEWMTGFVQIGESTMLTRFRIKLLFAYSRRKKTPYLYKFSNFVVGIDAIHSGNEILESSTLSRKINVFTRGAYQKEVSKKEEAEYTNGDNVQIKIIDFRRNSDELDILFDGKYYSDVGDSFYDLQELPLQRKEVFLHGILYKLMPKGDEGTFQKNYSSDGTPIVYNTPDAKYLKCTEKGFFNILITLEKILNNMFKERFCYNQNYNVSLIDSSKLSDLSATYCYISDLMMYKWQDATLSDALINLGYQLSAYVYSTEDGKISLHSRYYQQKYLPYNTLSPDSVEISIEDFSYRTGNKYGYGSNSYEIEYSDILEVNNLVSEEKEKKLVDKNGEATKAYVSPRKLELDIYRTSDLGAPSTFESFEDIDKVRYIRPGLQSGLLDFPNISMFPRLPIEQAQIYARSFVYPSIIVSISLDPQSVIRQQSYIQDEQNLYLLDEHGENIEDNFSGDSFPLSIGSYVHIQLNQGTYGVFMIKGISYSLPDLISVSNWLNIQLILIGYFYGSTNYLVDEQGNFVLDQNNQQIEQE